MTEHASIKASKLAGNGSVVSMPTYDYDKHFDRAADEAAFMERAERERKQRRNKEDTKRRHSAMGERTQAEADALLQAQRDRIKHAQSALTKKREAKFQKQRIQARALFADGHNYAEIALKMGVGKCRAHELVDEEYHQVVKRRKALCEVKRRKAA